MAIGGDEYLAGGYEAFVVAVRNRVRDEKDKREYGAGNDS